ncbi:MAG: hypothetical protein KDH97_24295 [Calditrichaeota bacterium]|nr:hypothetical protein [Calditrichota bacterium]
MSIRAQKFLQKVRTDIAAGRYCKDYVSLLRRVSDPELLRYLERDDWRPGQQWLYADVDHIVPRAVWPILTGMPELHAN